MKLLAALLVVMGMGTVALATQGTKGPTSHQIGKMKEHNANVRTIYQSQQQSSIRIKELHAHNIRSFAEYEDNGYVIFSAHSLFGAESLKIEIARNLPDDTTLIVYATDELQRSHAVNTYVPLRSKGKVKVFMLENHPEGNSFWTRDAVPVPTLTERAQLQLVDARYFQRFEPDQSFANLFNASLVSHDFYFEGGNLMVNRIGDCMVVNGLSTSEIDDEIFKNFYGCKRLHRLPLIKGIGHIDESLKFIDDHTVITDLQEYRDILTPKGFKVIMLPRPLLPYQTYANALMINGTAFVPVFGHPNDAEAIRIYESFGLMVVPLNSKALSEGRGSIHCITMNYPRVDMATLLRALNARAIPEVVN